MEQKEILFSFAADLNSYLIKLGAEQRLFTDNAGSLYLFKHGHFLKYMSPSDTKPDKFEYHITKENDLFLLQGTPNGITNEGELIIKLIANETNLIDLYGTDWKPRQKGGLYLVFFTKQNQLLPIKILTLLL